MDYLGNSSTGDLIPPIDDKYNLGTTSNRWKDVYLSGVLQLSDITAPANPGAAKGVLYKETGNDGLWWKPDAVGSAVDLTAMSTLITVPDNTLETCIVNDAGGQDYICIDSRNTNPRINIKTDTTFNGYLQLEDTADPLNPTIAGKGRLFKTTGNSLFWRPETGTDVYDLTNDSTKVTKGGDTGTLTIGTNNDTDFNLERNGNNVLTFGLSQTNMTIPHAITTAMLIHDSVENFLTIDTSNNKIISNQALQVDGDFRYNEGACEMYVENNTTVTSVALADGYKKVVFNSANTYVGFDSSFLGGSSFTVDTITNVGRITYTGARTRRAHCSVTISCTSDTNNVLLDFVIYKNGTTKVPGSEVKMFYAAGANKFISTAIHSLPLLVQNDYLELWISTTNGASIDVDVDSINFFCLNLPSVVA